MISLFQRPFTQLCMMGRIIAANILEKKRITMLEKESIVHDYSN